MTVADFQDVLSRRLRESFAVLAEKNGEYTENNDRLHSFKVSAGLLRSDSATALMGMLAKHWSNIMDKVDQFAATGKVPPQAWVDEKIGDAINYLILLEALFVEVRNAPPLSRDEILQEVDVRR